MTPDADAATRGGANGCAGCDGSDTLRGMPAGGVGITDGPEDCDGCGAATVDATPMLPAAIGCASGAAGCAGAGDGPEPDDDSGAPGALRADAAPGACADSRCPQC
jgi:hypothetical protein